MEYIESKDVFYLIKDILKFIDGRVVDHGYRVAYMVYKMLEYKGGFQRYELADIIILITLHDLGIYKKGNAEEMIYYDTKETLPHSVYGYLFCRYLSPHDEASSIILYHHKDYIDLPQELSEKERIICSCLSVAERMDVYNDILGVDFDYRMFQKFANSKLSGEALQLFYDVEEKHDILAKLKSGEFEEEMQKIIGYMIFSNEESRGYLKMLMYCLEFKSQATVIDTVTRVCICNQIGEKTMVSNKEKEMLYYASLLCDIGMLAMPADIIEAPRRLSEAEQVALRNHVSVAEAIMGNRMSQEVIAIISAHHERGDGSGYPRKIKDSQMNQMQRILQVADVMAALLNDRPYRKRKEKSEILEILGQEKKAGRLNRQIVGTVETFYDEIIEAVKKEEEEVLSTYKKLLSKYEKIEKELNNTK